MVKKLDWLTLPHEDRIRVLADTPLDRIVQDYSFGEKDEASFRERLARENRLWKPANINKFESAGKPPTKDVVLGAWRDLDRSEALLELIDNSIDIWLQRRKIYPKKTSPELNIYIDVDEGSHQLTYEDNAGGVSVDRVDNLVVPGFSDTTSLSTTIGSYKTGGKKAIFRLGTAVCITSRYWNPAESADETISVQLDENWIAHPTLYNFSYAQLKDKGIIEKGQTRYDLQLRDEPVGGSPWFLDPANILKISQDIRRTYTLLMIRNPDIHIYFNDRHEALAPLEDLYSFSGTNERGIDIQPQKIVFETTLPHEGQDHLIEIEIIIGCRRTSGTRDGGWGIDLYGNDRLFVAYDHDTFGSLLPQGNSRSLVRGLVNIRGGNVFVPWDTHKRHLNVDREVIQILTKNPLIDELFRNWRKVYNDISRGQVTKIISNRLAKDIDATTKDLFIPYRSRTSLDPKRKRGALPKDIFIPKVKTSRKKNDNISIRFPVTLEETRLLSSYYELEGDPASKATAAELGNEIKTDVLKKASRRRA